MTCRRRRRSLVVTSTNLEIFNKKSNLSITWWSLCVNWVSEGVRQVLYLDLFWLPEGVRFVSLRGLGTDQKIKGPAGGFWGNKFKRNTGPAYSYYDRVHQESSSKLVFTAITHAFEDRDGSSLSPIGWDRIGFPDFRMAYYFGGLHRGVGALATPRHQRR
jgi:hypothetical protein